MKLITKSAFTLTKTEIGAENERYQLQKDPRIQSSPPGL